MAEPVIQSLRAISLRLARLPPIAKTAIFGSLAATGAISGAMWKMSAEFQEEKQAIIQSTSAEKIANLENSRMKLLKQREELQLKIENLLRQGNAGTTPSAVLQGSTRTSGNR